MKISDIQRALVKSGFRPGPLDGIWGRRTAAAVRAFQASKGLEVDGIVGPATLAALLPGEAPAADLTDPTLLWFKEAARLIGTREEPGRGSNPRILDWADDLDIHYPGDDIPWCGLFVGHCIGSMLDREPLPSSLLSARAWLSFGIRTKPTPGAVMVFWRVSQSGGKGHVGFYAGENDRAYRILGGNQSDQVSLAWVAKSRFLDARWPATVPAPVPRSVMVGAHDTLSWDES